MRKCPLCGRRLFRAYAGVYHCPKGHQTVDAGRSPVLRVHVGKRSRLKRLTRRLFG